MFDRSSAYFGQSLSVDRPLFWALYIVMDMTKNCPIFTLTWLVLSKSNDEFTYEIVYSFGLGCIRIFNLQGDSCLIFFVRSNWKLFFFSVISNIITDFINSVGKDSKSKPLVCPKLQCILQTVQSQLFIYEGKCERGRWYLIRLIGQSKFSVRIFVLLLGLWVETV